MEKLPIIYLGGNVNDSEKVSAIRLTEHSSSYEEPTMWSALFALCSEYSN